MISRNSEELSSTDLANSRTKTDRELFLAIPEDEFNQYNNKNYSKPHIKEMIDNFNASSEFVITEIVKDPQSIDRWARTMNKCIKAGNLNGAFCILGAFNNTILNPIRGVDDKNLSSATKEIIEKADYIFSNLKGFKNYKEKLAKLRKSGHPIPFIGMVTRELTFSNENPTEETKKEMRDLVIKPILKDQEDNKKLLEKHKKTKPNPADNLWETENLLQSAKQNLQELTSEKDYENLPTEKEALKEATEAILYQVAREKADPTANISLKQPTQAKKADTLSKATAKKSTKSMNSSSSFASFSSFNIFKQRDRAGSIDINPKDPPPRQSSIVSKEGVDLPRTGETPPYSPSSSVSGFDNNNNNNNREQAGPSAPPEPPEHAKRRLEKETNENEPTQPKPISRSNS
ncbi:MAG: hypothetical protein EPO11_06885 [Gammaproteobacteria bacterium]|nr:MAG: hypothetical protein EPO11_06885 [Gammaproteobacteria bacterium]